MPKRSDKQVEPSVVESVLVITDQHTEFNPETFTIKNAALFAPPFDAASGCYRSNRGNPYARSSFQSIAEAASGALGWMYHPDLNESGEREIRKTSDAALKVTKASVVEQATGMAVRGDVKFIGKDKAGNYEVAQEGRHHLGFSVYIPRPVRNRDGVIEGVDQTFKRPLSVDLVEASSATKDITESVTVTPEKEEQTMDTKEIQAIVEAALAKQKLEIMESIKGDLDAGRAAKKEADSLKRAQLVESRLNEKKVGANIRTEALVESLAGCDSIEKMDKIIDNHKATLASLVDPVREAGAHVEVKQGGLVESIEQQGVNAVVESFATAVGSQQGRDAQILEKFRKSGLAAIGNYRDKSAATKKLRQAVIESVSFKKLLADCAGRAISTADDVTESAITSSSFSNINTALLSAMIIERYDITSAGFVAKDLSTPFFSTLKTETVPGYTQPTGITSVSEGSVYPDATMTEKYVAHPTLTKYGVRVLITREEILWDQKGLVLMRANTVADALAYDAEDRRIKQLIDNSTTTWYPSGAATALFDTTNTVTANPMNGSYLAVQNAATKLVQISDGNSRRLAANARRPLQILVPSSLEWLARYAVMPSMQLRSNANANITQGDNPFAGSEIYVSSILDAVDANTWYVSGKGGFQEQYLVKQNIPFEVVQIPQAEIQGVSYDLVGGVRAAIMEALFARDNKFVVKCQAT